MNRSEVVKLVSTMIEGEPPGRFSTEYIGVLIDGCVDDLSDFDYARCDAAVRALKDIVGGVPALVDVEAWVLASDVRVVEDEVRALVSRG